MEEASTSMNMGDKVVLSVLGEAVQVIKTCESEETLYTFRHEKSMLRISADSFFSCTEDFYQRFASVVVLHAKFGKNRIKHTITNTELLKSLYQEET